jgi:hypothetical protein
MLTVQLPVPVQAPPQPLNVEPMLAVAFKVTLVPLLKLAPQVEPQLMPAGLEITVPLPVPLLVTLREYVVGVLAVKLAVTLVVALTATAQFPVPAQAPLQPVKVEPAAGAAERVTFVPPATFALQMLPQLIPLGVEVTVPLPVPPFATVTL